jgi:hypothetical protein
MSQKIFKVHTDTFGRLVACIQRAMYGVSNTAFTREMPRELLEARAGDIVFISEREVSKNALFGPFYIVDDRPSIVCKSRKAAWVNIDTNKTPSGEIAYWVDLERRNWCLLFDKTLSDRISIVWPYDWSRLRVDLPSWGLVKGDDAAKLIQFALANEVEAREFLRRHDVW